MEDLTVGGAVSRGIPEPFVMVRGKSSFVHKFAETEAARSDALAVPSTTSQLPDVLAFVCDALVRRRIQELLSHKDVSTGGITHMF